MENFLFILSGPTGSGKSALSLKLAEYYRIEIVNCDIGSFYQPIAIGTAKPDWKDSSIPHHFFDFIVDPIDFTVTEYRQKLQRTIADIQNRGNIPLLVGGSLFYIRSLFFPPISVFEKKDKKQSIDFTEPPHRLWDELYKIDPDRALALQKNDSYRIIRALEIWEATGKKPSEFIPQFNPLGNFYCIFLSRDRSDLYQRINGRVREMMKRGWVDEVAQLSSEWQNFLLEKKLIGYPEIIQCLAEKTVQECSMDENLIQAIQKKTRNYAKRQCTYWRMFKKELDSAVALYNVDKVSMTGITQEVNLTLSSVDLYLEQIVKQVNEKHFERS